MRRLKRLVAAIFLVAACARMAPPPGGPPRHTPPVLVSTFPDSGTAPCNFKGSADFQFDEVTSDAGEPNFGTGSGALEKLIIFSPDTSVPSVDWHRSRISVRPRGGWRDHVVYRIELLSGLLDLHQNTMKTGAVITFATCGPKPTRQLSGRAIDWTTRRAMRRAVIEAYNLTDSLTYRTLADSTGRFHLESLPDGPYLVFAADDREPRHRRRAALIWDSVRVDAAQDTVGEIWAFPRDTLPLRLQTVVRVDSFTISVTFRGPIDPALRLDSTSIRVGLLPPGSPADTVSIGPVNALPKTIYDSIHKAQAPRNPKADSVARVDSLRKDSIGRAAPPPPPPPKPTGPPLPPPDLPKQNRPVLDNIMLITTRGVVQQGSSYFVELRDMRVPGGRPVPPVRGSFAVPKAPSPADSAKAHADSAKTKAHADSVKRADSLKQAAGGRAGGGPFEPK